MTKYELLYESIKTSFERYDEKRIAASEILDVNGMEEAIVDELKSRGYEVEEDN